MGIEIAPENWNTVEHWDTYHRESWQAKQGREQTRLFAEYFLDVVQIPPEVSTLLDVGCAMGDSMPEFHKRYPHLQLTGCDVTPSSIDVARRSYAKIATFEQWGFLNIPRHFDAIYCSNVLEHFEASVDIAAEMLKHCRWLYLLVPYRQHDAFGNRLTVRAGEQHVTTFYDDSFDELKRRGLAQSIETYHHPCPGAWGGTEAWWRVALRQTKRKLLRRPRWYPWLQIFYVIRSTC
jgi:trans-aconitate methyltransferase